MFPDRQQVSYAHEFPELWKEIKKSSAGQFEKDGYIVSYRRLGDLVNAIPSTQPRNDLEKTQLQLIAVSQLSPETISGVVNNVRFSVIITSVIFSTLLIISIVAFIMFRQQRRYLKKQAQLHAVAMEEQSKQLAADIQNMLLLEPITEKSKQYEFARILKSCHHVGGDFIGYWKFESAGDILIGDVMGKGVAGALLAAATKIQFANAFRDAFLRQHHLPSPRQIVDYVRDNISDTLLKLERFVSLNFARLNLEEHTIEFIDCGHTRPILYRRSEDRMIFLEGGNMPLGFMPGEKSEQVKYDIYGGDLLMFYSDGVTETRNPETRELFGTDRLTKVIRDNKDMPAEKIIENLEKVLSEFQGSDMFIDDLTCIVIRINEDGPVSGKRGR